MKMNQTLVALAVTASAVSGTALAGWTATGTGGEFQLGGTLTPLDNVPPWEVAVGADMGAIAPLDANIEKGTNKVIIRVTKAIPVLGIRTRTNDAFPGRTGIAPQISYGQAVDPDAFTASEAPLTLDVTDSTGNTKLGTLSTTLFAGGIYSTLARASNMYAPWANRGFWGGLPKAVDKLAPPETVPPRLAAISTQFASNFNDQGHVVNAVMNTAFNVTNDTYSGYYGSGIEAGSKVTITLNSPATGDNAIAWKATLPVTVSYM